MPNHVQNDICIKGPKATLEQIAEFMRGPDSAFDFNKILPMPAELQSIATGGTTIDGKQYRRWRTVDGKDIGIDDAEIARLTAEHGASDWHDWACHHWGTKWNAYSVGEPTMTSRSLRYRFDTAWASPEPVLQAIADKFGVSISVNVSGEVDQRYRYAIAA